MDQTTIMARTAAPTAAVYCAALRSGAGQLPVETGSSLGSSRCACGSAGFAAAAGLSAFVLEAAALAFVSSAHRLACWCLTGGSGLIGGSAPAGSVIGVLVALALATAGGIAAGDAASLALLLCLFHQLIGQRMSAFAGRTAPVVGASSAEPARRQGCWLKPGKVKMLEARPCRKDEAQLVSAVQEQQARADQNRAKPCVCLSAMEIMVVFYPLRS